MGFGNTMQYIQCQFIAVSVCVSLAESCSRVKVPLSGTVLHEASIQCSLHGSSLQPGAYDQPYTSPNPKRNGKMCKFKTD